MSTKRGRNRNTIVAIKIVWEKEKDLPSARFA
jgi:hypothetical protein